MIEASQHGCTEREDLTSLKKIKIYYVGMSIILNSYIQNLTFQPQENNKNSYHLRGKKAAESQR